jgi:hypothetical protein
LPGWTDPGFYEWIRTVNDEPQPPVVLMAGPLGEELNASLAWAREHTEGGELEIFLNPADAGPLLGGAYKGHPIYQSIGVPAGRVLVFDRDSGQYIRKGQRP